MECENVESINGLLDSVRIWSISYGFQIIKAIFILFIGVWAINKTCRFTAVFLRQSNLEIGVISFFNYALKFFLRIILFILILPVLGINVTSVIAAVGASLVTVGLVFKDSLCNFASGILIILNKPIRVGDYVEFENTRGTVTKIEMMFTTLRSDDEKSIIIPNFRLTSNNIIRKSDYDICKSVIDYYVMGENSKIDIHKIVEFSLISDNRILQLPPPEIKCEILSGQKARVSISLFCEKRYTEDINTILMQTFEGSLKKYKLKIQEI